MKNKKWEINYIPPENMTIEYTNMLIEYTEFIIKKTWIPTDKTLLDIRTEKIVNIKNKMKLKNDNK